MELEPTNAKLSARFTSTGLRNRGGVIMMPLTLADSGEELIIRKIGGNGDTRRFLEGLGFVVGGNITVVSENGGNVIVKVKESRVAVSKEMAMRVMV